MSTNGAVAGVNHLSIFGDAGEVAAAAEAFVVTKLEQSIGEGRDVDLVLAGGATPRAVYERMARSDRAIDWSHVRLWLGDERFVAQDDPESNAGMVRSTLLGSDGSGIPIPRENVYFPPVDDVLASGGDPAECADRYSSTVLSFMGRDQLGRLRVDMVMAGIGSVGDTLAIFPGSRAFVPVAGHVVDVQPSEDVEPNVARITLTPRFFTLATDVLVLAVGSNKAQLVARAFEGARQPADLPAQLLVRPNATWLLDEAAASQLAT